MSVSEQISIIIPSGEKDREALRNGIKEIDASMTRKDAEQDYIRESITELSEKFGIDKKYIRRMATDFHKSRFDKEVQALEEYSALYESVME